MWVYVCCGSILSLVQIFFSFFLGIVMYDNEFETKEKKIWTKDKIEPQHLYHHDLSIHGHFDLLEKYFTIFRNTEELRRITRNKQDSAGKQHLAGH